MKSMKSKSASRASHESCVPESQETVAEEGRSHPASFLRKATRVAEKKSSGKRAAKKRG